MTSRWTGQSSQDLDNVRESGSNFGFFCLTGLTARSRTGHEAHILVLWNFVYRVHESWEDYVA